MDKKVLLFILLLVLASFLSAPYVASNSYIYHVSLFVLFNIVLASSLRLITISGQLSLAHGGMMAIGSYSYAILTTKCHILPLLAFLLSGVSGLILAALIGLPFTRLKGIYFSIASLFFTAIVVVLAQQWRTLTGGPLGMYNIPGLGSIKAFGINVALSNRVPFYVFCFFLSAFSLLFIYRIEKSWVGYVFKTIRQSDLLAESVGINVIFYRVLAFTIGSFFAVLTGGLYAQYMGSLTPSAFGLLHTLYILIYMVAGGQHSFVGPIAGASVLTILPEILRPLKQWQPIFYALLLIGIIYFEPKGLIGVLERLNGRFRRLVKCLR